MVTKHEVKKKFQTNFSLSIADSISKNKFIAHLQKKIDAAERQQFNEFYFLNDLEVIMWYLYRRTNLNEEKEKSEKTVKAYRKVLEQFILHIMEYHQEIGLDLIISPNATEISLLRLLEKRHMRKYQEWLATNSPYVLKNGPYSPATLENKITIIKTFLSFLYKHSYIEKPIHEGFLSIGVHKDERPNRDAGPKHVTLLLDGFDRMGHIPMYTFVQVLTTTGIRNEEFCKLKVRDIKEDNILGGYYIDVHGKGNKKRQVPLRAKTLEVIRKFRAARGLSSLEDADQSEPLFTTNRLHAYSPSYLSQYFKKQIQLLPAETLEEFEDVEITPHLFRHAFAIISRLEGVDIYTIMRSLGHERIETTQIYLEKIFAKEQHAIHQWKNGVLGKYI